MFNYELMKSMKIIDTNDNSEEFIRKIISKLKELELKYDRRNTTYLENIERLIIENKIVLGTPILKNLLDDNEPVSSCTIVPVDLRKDINNLKAILEPYAATTMGSGYDLNLVDDPCDTIEKINSVIHDLIQIYPNRLSAMGTLDVNSPHILDFIDLKKKRDFNTCHYNISIKISDDFFDGEKEYEVLKNGVKVRLTNLEILRKISEAIHYCAEPGIIFVDRFNQTNPLPQKQYEYKSVAPCAEIAMSEGEVCQFSYINLAKMIDENGNIDKEELKLSVQVITRMLDNLCDISIRNAKSNPEIIEDKRRIGVGVCGFADMLAKLKLPYDSIETRELTKDLFTFINFYSKVESVNLSRERGSFRKYNDSLCGQENWYNRFRKNKNEWVSDIDWQALINGIQKYGIRNSSTTAVPPTGRSASIVNASYSIEPYFTLYDSSSQTGLNPIFIDYIRNRYSNNEQEEIIKTVLKTGDCSQLDDRFIELKEIYKTAREINAEDHIEVMAIINSCIDESISKTVNLPNKTSVEQIQNYILQAYNKGLNGITFFRDRCLEERNIDMEEKER